MFITQQSLPSPARSVTHQLPQSTFTTPSCFLFVAHEMSPVRQPVPPLIYLIYHYIPLSLTYNIMLVSARRQNKTAINQIVYKTTLFFVSYFYLYTQEHRITFTFISNRLIVVIIILLIMVYICRRHCCARGMHFITITSDAYYISLRMISDHPLALSNPFKN